jgi:predicted nucleotidyltransferase component of viral defense system
MRPSTELAEFSHLNLLQGISRRLSGRAYALKGGICLRFFHRSPRLSQDMDLDVSPQVRVKTLQTAVDSILEGRSLLAALAPWGVTRLRSTKPKQTHTTQRWKVSLEQGGGVSLPTRIEFSRRRKEIPSLSGIPDAALLGRYRMPPFAAQFYGSTEMAAQKITALAAPSRYAIRDLFDLHHLFFTLSVNPAQVASSIRLEQIEQAAQKIRLFTHRDFKGQVLPYLTETLAAHYSNPAAFEGLKGAVEEALIPLLP